MTLPRFNHRALPVNLPGEGRVENERRYRAEVERALRQGDIALRQIEAITQQISDGAVTEDEVIALIQANRPRGFVEAEYTNRVWSAAWYEIASFRSTGVSITGRDEPNYLGTMYFNFHWSRSPASNYSAFHMDFGFFLAGNAGTHMDVRYSTGDAFPEARLKRIDSNEVVFEVRHTDVKDNSTNGAAISIAGPRGANAASLPDVTIKAFTAPRSGTVLQTVAL